LTRRGFIAALTLGLCALITGPAIADPLGAKSVSSFKRGATLVEFFEFPKIEGEGAARRYAEPAYPDPLSALNLFDFDELHRIGFDHMRVPLDVGPLMRADERTQADIIAHLVAVVSAINGHGLAVLVTLFPPSLHHELPQTYLDGLDGPKFRAYAAVVGRVATALAAVDSGIVALEPMNEPQSECRITFGTDWTAYQQVMIERIRRISSQLPLFLTGGCWSNIEGIVALDTDLLHDRRNFVSVHFYYPFLFTHQGANWSEPYLAGTIGVPYPALAGGLAETLALTHARFRTLDLPQGTDRVAAERAAIAGIEKYFNERQGPVQIEEWMNKVADWQRRVGIDPDRIVFTEFGAMKQTIGGSEIDRASRARWLHDASANIASRGWGWTAYVLRDDPFGLYLHESDRNPDPELMRALGLDAPKTAPQSDRHTSSSPPVQ
jgi:endoglucanase